MLGGRKSGRTTPLGYTSISGRRRFRRRVLAEGVHVPLPGQQELQEAHAPVPAGLVDAQQHQVVRQPGLLQAPGVPSR